MNDIVRLLIATIIAFCSVARAQEVARPIHKVGYWCEYSTSARAAKVRYEIMAVAADGGFTLKASSDSVTARFEQTSIYNADHSLIARDHVNYSPGWSDATYPLKAGKLAGGGKFRYNHARRPGVWVEAETTVKSATLEKITVPAGTFDAIKIESVMNYRLTTGYENKVEQLTWYSLDPMIKRYLKRDSIDHGISANDSARERREVRELIACGGG